MILRLLAVALALVLMTGHAEARHRHHHHAYARVKCAGTYCAIVDATSDVVAHPAGCPRVAFCGCGAAIEVFGRPIRALWLAANWFRFPRAEPAPGMAAVRPHHVMVIREIRGDGRALVYDANSGGHLTRVHVRSLAGYRIVNPRGG